MPGLSLVTKGMLTKRKEVQISAGGGGAGLRKEDDIIKPVILVDKFTMSKSGKPDINENTVKVKSVKIVLE